jgi:hypothetical protein
MAETKTIALSGIAAGPSARPSRGLPTDLIASSSLCRWSWKAMIPTEHFGDEPRLHRRWQRRKVSLAVLDPPRFKGFVVLSVAIGAAESGRQFRRFDHHLKCGGRAVGPVLRLARFFADVTRFRFVLGDRRGVGGVVPFGGS